MTSSPIEAAFSRFKETDDPASLAEVYDRCAPELLRVAMHLSDKPGDAEDLVQSTFLIAIERADTFDASRRVLPWLLGILANCARTRRRKANRELLDSELERVIGEDPVALVEASEFSRALDAAIAKLPAQYQTVFVLRFRHGLSTPEIAKALGRPAGTVRTQLVRGLEMLRASLPAGFGATIAASLFADRGLTAVRREVLARASAKQAAAVVASTSVGLMLAKQIGLLLVAVVALLAALGWLLPAGPAARTDSRELVLESSASEPDAPVAARSSALGAEPGVELASNQVRAERRSGVVITGRCIRAENNAPLPGCTVTVESSVDVPGSASKRFDSKPCTSDAVGRFEAALAIDGRTLASASVSFSIHVVADGRADVRQPVPVVAHSLDDFPIDIGDISMWKGYPVRGRVVDGDRAAVSGVVVRLEGLPNALVAYAPMIRLAPFDKTGEDGGFAFEIRLPAGTWPLSVAGRGVTLVSPTHVEVGEASAERSIDVVVRRERERPTITGTVLDTVGRPIAGLVVHARWDWPENLKSASAKDVILLHPRRHEILRGWAETDASGRFRLVAGDVAPPSVHLGSFGWGPRRRLCEAFHDARVIEWGSTGIELRAKRMAALEVHVVEAANGKPVEDFAVFCYPDPPRLTTVQPLFAGSSAEGRARVTPPGHGAHWLVVAPKRRDLLPSTRQRVQISDAATTEVALVASCPVRVRVVDASDRPVVGSKLRVYDATGMPAELGLDSGLMTEYRHVFGGHAFVRNRYQPDNPLLGPKANRSGPDAPLVTDEAVTDGSGRALVYAPQRGARAVLHVLGPGHLPKLVDPLAGSLEEVTVTVDRGASVEVEIAPLSVVQAISRTTPGMQLELRHVADRRPQMVWGDRRTATYRSVSVPGDGRVREDGLRPGTWTLKALHGEQTIELEAGKTRKVELDYSRFAPARLSGKVSVAGKPPVDAYVRLVDSDGTLYQHGTQFDVDGSGRFIAPFVLPGTYRLVLTTHKSRPTEQMTYPASERFELPASGSLEKEFSFRHARLRVRVVAADGETPLANTRFVVSGEPWFEKWVTTDAEGRFVLEPAPDREITLLEPFTIEQWRAAAEHRPIERKQIGPARVPSPPERGELVLRER